MPAILIYLGPLPMQVVNNFLLLHAPRAAALVPCAILDGVEVLAVGWDNKVLGLVPLV